MIKLYLASKSMSVSLVAAFKFGALAIATGFLAKFGADIYTYTQKNLLKGIEYTFNVSERALPAMNQWLADHGGYAVNNVVYNVLLGSLLGGATAAFLAATLLATLVPVSIPLAAGFGALWVGGGTLLGFGGQDNQIPYWYFR